MYFHLVWIKEKNWKKYELDFLLQWWDEDFLRRFLSNRWVVIVSLTIFDGNTKDFWNISIHVKYDDSEVQILMAWDNLEDSAYFIFFIWLSPNYINYVDKPIDEQRMRTIIESTLKKITEENEKIRLKQEAAEKKEQEKYSESSIEEWLKVINTNISRIEEVLKAGPWVISWSNFKKLEDLLDELKKIRLWTNFNKMVALILQSHELVEHAENQIFEACQNQKILIDENSSLTNIDFISWLYEFNKISEKGIIDSAFLSNYESIYNIFWIKSAFFLFLYKDFLSGFKWLSFPDYFSIIMVMLEWIILTANIILMIIWLISPIFWMEQSSLYLLPALWWWWLLLYFFNNLKLKSWISQVVAFVVVVILFFVWLNLLKGTFSI